jgi:hypothetical protein
MAMMMMMIADGAGDRDDADLYSEWLSSVNWHIGNVYSHLLPSVPISPGRLGFPVNCLASRLYLTRDQNVQMSSILACCE